MKIDSELFEDLQYNYQENVRNFKTQNSGLLIDNVARLNEDELIKFIQNVLHLDNQDTYIDRKFINQHFINFAICPVVAESKGGYTTHVDLVPDIICETYK